MGSYFYLNLIDLKFVIIKYMNRNDKTKNENDKKGNPNYQNGNPDEKMQNKNKIIVKLKELNTTINDFFLILERFKIFLPIINSIFNLNIDLENLILVNP